MQWSFASFNVLSLGPCAMVDDGAGSRLPHVVISNTPSRGVELWGRLLCAELSAVRRNMWLGVSPGTPPALPATDRERLECELIHQAYRRASSPIRSCRQMDISTTFVQQRP